MTSMQIDLIVKDKFHLINFHMESNQYCAQCTGYYFVLCLRCNIQYLNINQLYDSWGCILHDVFDKTCKSCATIF